MSYRRLLILLVLSMGMAILPAYARIAAPAPIADRVARANTVILGHVTSIEEKGVTHEGSEYKVAIVKIADALKGAKGQTHVRVAFQPVTRFPANRIEKDQDVILFLHPVKGQPFFATHMYYDIVNKTSPSWKDEVAAVKECAKVAADAPRLLKEGTPDEKLLAAAMLILQYRDATNTNGKQEPIDAAQSKAILTVLADSDWTRQGSTGPLGTLNGQTLFYRLGVTPADGWMPQPGVNVADTAKKWLKANADKFVLKKFLTNEG